MIGLLLIAAAGLGWWAWKTRNAQALRFGDVTAVVVALIGVRFLSRAEMLPALVALGGAGWWAWSRRRARPTQPGLAGMSADRARALLDVPRNASADEIRAAHRRLARRVHPDAGGSNQLAAEVNAARDTLLATDVKR